MAARLTASQKLADKALRNGQKEYARESKRLMRKAAPLLLAALQGLNHMGGDDRGGYCICPCNDGSAPSHKHSTACRDARIAIAAATGESINGLEF